MKKLFLIILSVLLMSLIFGCSKLGNPSPDYTSLAVSSVTPLDNAIGVSIKSTVSVTFSSAMNKSSAQSAFTIVDSSAKAVSGGFSWNGNTMTFTPDPDLKLNYNTVYTCTVGTGAKDTMGNALGSAYTWIFKTVYSSDTTLPTIFSVTPLENAIEVAISPTISVTFSEAMNEASAQDAFTISGGVTGSFNWIGNIMIFTPGAALASNTTYTCTEGTGAQDLTGNSLEAAKTWSFTTGITDTIAPTVIFTLPSKDATAVPITSAISVTFSEAMNKSSAQSAFAIVDSSTNPVSVSFDGWTGNTMIFTPVSALANNIKYTCTVDTGAQDLAGNHMAAHEWSFTTIHLPPTVISSSPSGTNVPVSSSLVVTFSQPMDKDSTQLAGYCNPSVGEGNSSTISWDTDGEIMTFTHPSLTTKTEYACGIHTSAQDLDGNHLEVEYKWSFTTAP